MKCNQCDIDFLARAEFGGEFLCSYCLSKAGAEFDALRAQHEELLRKGVHPKIASARMVALVEKED